MPRHPLCALINLTTIIDHFLIDELFLNLNIILLDKRIITLTQKIALSSFQRTKSERNNLSKPSKKSIVAFRETF